MVLAGGVNALVTPAVTLGFDEVGGVLAPDGRIKSFSSDADGYARSEGGGMLVLKRLEDARRDGDDIPAVIAGSAINHDGRSNGMLAPNPDAQAEVLCKAYHDAGINPRTVDYIEAHGTGTILGDLIEADALGCVVGRGRPLISPRCSVRSSQPRHLSRQPRGEPGQVALSFAQQPDSAINQLCRANPTSTSTWCPETNADTVSEWPRYSGHAIAEVRSDSGANAHLVLREVLPEDLINRSPSRTPKVSRRIRLPPVSMSAAY